MNSSDTRTSFTQSTAQVWNDPIDLAKCNSEPVQMPGAIMPHGVMLILGPNEYCILGASANTAAWFHCPAGNLLGGHLDRIVTEEVRQTLESGLALLTEPLPPRYLGCFQTLKNEHRFDVLAHRSGDVLVLEFEFLPGNCTGISVTERFAEVADSITNLQAAETWQEGMNIAVRELKRMTGFDSVIGVRLLADGTGHAVAEARNAEFATFLDKRFPYSDMPEPARRQMLLMPVQYAPEHDYERVPLVMATAELNPEQIDLGYSVLRSMSPLCSRYYINMGAQSRLLLVLLNQGQLWGFFSCLSATPRQVIYSDRLAYHSFAQIATPLLIEKDKAEHDRQALKTMHKIDALLSQLSSAPVFQEALDNLPTQLLETGHVAGVALCLDNRLITSGVTPEEEQIKVLISWLDQQGNVLTSYQLPTLFASAAEYADKATGVMAMRLMEPGQYLLGFRPEWVYEVSWAGDPHKPVEIDVNSGEHRLMPRGSFEVWKEVVRGRARPWQPYEIEALSELRQSIIVLQLSDKRLTLSARLQRSNTELETFAYVVSHDLQEPLRGILKTSHLLKEAATARLAPQDLDSLDTIIKKSGRMSELIQAVLQYSRAGQESVDREMVNLNDLLESVLESLSVLIAESGAQVHISSPLPYVLCDPIRTAAVFQNLICNGIKYNDQAEKRIEIGCLEGPAITLFVRDNGIGIPPQHQEGIFTIFLRLHAREAYGGGSGAGLTIARKHIEKHGGRLWLESIPNQGSTFFFTLEPA